MKFNTLLLSCTILLMACDDDSSFETGSDNYLPLEVGNIWIFKSLQDNSDYKDFKRVTAEITFDNLVYAEVVSGRFYPDSNLDDSTYDTSYYRVDNNGHVYCRRKNSVAEENIFRLNAVDGDTWTYPTENRETVVITVSLVDLELSNKNLRNCKAYYYDVNQWIDEENTTMLAQGIGFVKEYADWGTGHVLESATINGREFNF
jgi:hypothetical protein